MPDADIPRDLVAACLKSQYHASLAMLHECIERCPDALWLDRAPRNAFWQVAYHTLFFAHFYLMPTEHDFTPWERHQGEDKVQCPDGIPGPPIEGDPRPLVADPPYSREELAGYCRLVDAMVDEGVDALDLASAQSGFPWYPIPKLEHQLVNVRHIQHGAAQLADRLRAHGDVGIRWAGARKAMAQD